MIEKSPLTTQQTVRLARLQAWAMSFLCGLLFIFAIAASLRVPLYLVEMDIPRLVGAFLFDLLVLIGLVSNICVHISLWQAKKFR